MFRHFPSKKCSNCGTALIATAAPSALCRSPRDESVQRRTGRDIGRHCRSVECVYFTTIVFAPWRKKDRS